MKKYIANIMAMLLLLTLAGCEREDIMGDVKLLPKMIPSTVTKIPYHKNIVGHWKFDDLDNKKEISVISSFELSKTGIITIPDSAKFGYCRASFSINSYYEWVDPGTGPTVFDNDFMVEAWITYTNNGNFQTILSKDTIQSGVNKGWSCDINMFDKAQISYGDNTNSSALSSYHSINTKYSWHYIVFVFRNSSGTGVAYVDGEINETNTSLMTYNASLSTNMVLGCTNFNSAKVNPFNGMIDDVVFWGNINQVDDNTIKQYVVDRWNDGVGREYGGHEGMVIFY